MAFSRPRVASSTYVPAVAVRAIERPPLQLLDRSLPEVFWWLPEQNDRLIRAFLLLIVLEGFVLDGNR